MRCIWVGVGFYFRTFTITSGLDRAAAFSQMFTNSSGERFKKFGSNRARRDGAAPFKVWPYVDDAMFAELRIEERETDDCITCRGWRCKRFFGDDAVGAQKAELEGKWPTNNILFGLTIDTKSVEITTPCRKDLRRKTPGVDRRLPPRKIDNGPESHTDLTRPVSALGKCQRIMERNHTAVGFAVKQSGRSRTDN